RGTAITRLRPFPNQLLFKLGPGSGPLKPRQWAPSSADLTVFGFLQRIPGYDEELAFSIRAGCRKTRKDRWRNSCAGGRASLYRPHETNVEVRNAESAHGRLCETHGST